MMMAMCESLRILGEVVNYFYLVHHRHLQLIVGRAVYVLSHAT